MKNVFLHSRSGTAGVEMALVAPLLAAALIGVIDAGIALQKYRHAFQAASSVAQTAVYLSIADAGTSAPPTLSAPSMMMSTMSSEALRGGDDKGAGSGSTASSGSSSTLQHGLDLTFGSGDASRANASAVRIVRGNGGAMNTVWGWNSQGATQVQPQSGEYMPLMRDGESLVVAEVSFQHQFFFVPVAGGITLSARYSASVPTY